MNELLNITNKFGKSAKKTAAAQSRPNDGQQEHPGSHNQLMCSECSFVSVSRLERRLCFPTLFGCVRRKLVEKQLVYLGVSKMSDWMVKLMGLQKLQQNHREEGNCSFILLKIE